MTYSARSLYPLPFKLRVLRGGAVTLSVISHKWECVTKHSTESLPQCFTYRLHINVLFATEDDPCKCKVYVTTGMLTFYKLKLWYRHKDYKLLSSPKCPRHAVTDDHSKKRNWLSTLNLPCPGDKCIYDFHHGQNLYLLQTNKHRSSVTYTSLVQPVQVISPSRYSRFPSQWPLENWSLPDGTLSSNLPWDSSTPGTLSWCLACKHTWCSESIPWPKWTWKKR